MRAGGKRMGARLRDSQGGGTTKRRKTGDYSWAQGRGERRAPGFWHGQRGTGHYDSLRKEHSWKGLCRKWWVLLYSNLFAFMEFDFQFSEEWGYKSLWKLKIAIKSWYHCVWKRLSPLPGWRWTMLFERWHLLWLRDNFRSLPLANQPPKEALEISIVEALLSPHIHFALAVTSARCSSKGVTTFWHYTD